MLDAIRFPLWIDVKTESSDVGEFVVVNRNVSINAVNEDMLTEAGERVAEEMNQSVYGSNVNDIER